VPFRSPKRCQGTVGQKKVRNQRVKKTEVAALFWKQSGSTFINSSLLSVVLCESTSQ